MRPYTGGKVRVQNSAVTFGIKKHKEAQEGIEDLLLKVEELRKKKTELKKKELDLNSKISAINTKNTEYKSIIESMWKEEEDMLKYQGDEMESYIESMKELNASPLK